MLGDIIGGIGSVVGGLLGASEAKKNRKLQKKFAQNGIQWRATDARKAGIHPLAALGASGAQYQPVNSGLGSAVADGMSRIGAAANNASTAALDKAQVNSAIKVNEAQAKLLEAQTVSTLHQMSQPLGAVGGKVPLANPNKKVPDGWTKDNPIPSTVWVKTEDGQLIQMLNPDLSSDFGETLATFGQGLFQRARAGAAPKVSKAPAPEAKSFPAQPSRGDRVTYKGKVYIYHPRFGWRTQK